MQSNYFDFIFNYFCLIIFVFIRYSTDCEIYHMIQKTILVILFIFLKQKQTHIILLVVYMLSGLLLYNTIRIRIYYYNTNMYKIVCAQHFYTFWTGIILLIGDVNFIFCKKNYFTRKNCKFYSEKKINFIDITGYHIFFTTIPLVCWLIRDNYFTNFE